MIVYIALLGWIPLVVVLFALLPSRHAAAAAIVGAWLFLPPYSILISSFPDYNKNAAASLGIILATLFFGFGHIVAFRPKWFDLPMLLWCLCGIPSSVSNGLGLYDGLSSALRQALYWGLPYFIGRLYFCDVKGLRLFAFAMTIGGLLYVPLCLWEIRMSPRLLGDVYGQSRWQGIRYGGFRPTVFFASGLELGMWMTAASLTAWWLWYCGVIKRLGQFSFGMAALPILLGTTVLCRATGALVLLVGGMFLLWASTRFKTKMLLWALVLFGPIYFGTRIPNLWSGKALVNLISQYISKDRADSLAYRFMCENLLVAKAIQQPLLGWGGSGRMNVNFDESSENAGRVVAMDGLWIITLGNSGFVGLSLLYVIMELPVIIFLWRVPVQLWDHPQIAPASLAATLLGLYMIDCTLNGFINIIYATLAGGLVGAVSAQFGIRPRKVRKGGVSDQPNGPERRLNKALSPPKISGGDLGEGILADRYRSLGRICKKRGQLHEAQAAWQKALDIFTSLSLRDPSNSDLQRRWCDCANDLAWLLLSHSDPGSCDPVSGLALAGQVIARCSDCGAYWNTLGVACFRSGDFAAAIVALERSVALVNGDIAFNHVFLAMAYAQLNQVERARYHFDRADNQMAQRDLNHAELSRFHREAQHLLSTL
jgi:hypothetical protein